MKILIIGGTGTVGKTIVDYFSKEQEVIIASRSSEDFPIDISSTVSIKQLMLPGHTPIPMLKMLRGYIRSVEGKGSGQIIRIYD